MTHLNMTCAFKLNTHTIDDKLFQLLNIEIL